MRACAPPKDLRRRAPDLATTILPAISAFDARQHEKQRLVRQEQTGNRAYRVTASVSWQARCRSTPIRFSIRAVPFARPRLTGASGAITSFGTLGAAMMARFTELKWAWRAIPGAGQLRGELSRIGEKRFAALFPNGVIRGMTCSD